MTFFIVMFILLMQFLWRYIDDLVGKGLDLKLIAELLLYASVGLIPMALPLATMLAALMTMGNLGEHNELLAMKSAGISLPRIIFPLAMVSLFVTLFGYLVADYLVPVSTLKMRTLIYSVQQQRPDIVIRPGVFYNDIAGYSIRIGGRESDGSLMYDLLIYDHSERHGNISVTRADSGYITITPDRKFMLVELFSGTRYDETDQDAPFNSTDPKYTSRTSHFKRERLIKRLEGFGFERSDEGVFSNTYHVMNTRQLQRASDSIATRCDSMTDAEHTYLNKGVLLRPQNLSFLPSNPIRDTFHVQEYFATLSAAKKREALARAIEQAQNVKGHIYNFAVDYEYELKTRAKHLIEFNRKYSLSIAILIFFLIGAPLGAIIRKGGLGFPVVISVLFFIVYYVISITGEKMVRQLMTSAHWGMWGSSFILLPIAIFLIYKATTDSVILSREGYRGVDRFFTNLHKKALKLLHKKGKQT